MSENKNEQVIVAFFESQAIADAAAMNLQEWDKANKEIELGAVGTISKQDGKVKTHVGRKTGQGAVVGTVIGVIAAILSGGLTLIGGMVIGGASGGIVGAFMKKSTNLTKEEIEQIGNELDAGRVAVVVTCDPHELDATRQQLINAGGKVRNYTVPQEAFTEAAKAVENAESAAVETAPAEVVAEALDEAAMSEGFMEEGPMAESMPTEKPE
jgi:uncharacterized membrane protein